jgi:hypothetical protein
VRTRNTKSASAKAFKFERVPFLQRVTRVCANSTGAFGALRVDYTPTPIEVVGNTLAQDLKQVQPYLDFYHDDVEGQTEALVDGTLRERRQWSHALRDTVYSQQFDDEPEDEGIARDIEDVLELCDVLACEHQMRKRHGGRIAYEGVRLPHGADTMLLLPSGEAFPVHRALLAARSRVLAAVLSGAGAVADAASGIGVKLLSPKAGATPGVPKISRLAISNAQPLAVLILLRYVYSDELLAVWDRRIGTAVAAQAAGVGADLAQVRAELQALARLLDLAALAEALQAPVKRAPAPTMAAHMRGMFETAQGTPSRASPVAPDVVLEFADRDVCVHAVLLRARSPLFASFFGLEEWTRKRWDAEGVIRVDMKHLQAHAMEFVVRFMCCGADEEMFEYLGMGIFYFLSFSFIDERYRFHNFDGGVDSVHVRSACGSGTLISSYTSQCIHTNPFIAERTPSRPSPSSMLRCDFAANQHRQRMLHTRRRYALPHPNAHRQTARVHLRQPRNIP